MLGGLAQHIVVNPDSTFKIIVFSDLDLPENDSVDEMTLTFVQEALELEEPDFAVLIGDTVDPTVDLDLYDTYFKLVTDTLDLYNVILE